MAGKKAHRLVIVSPFHCKYFMGERNVPVLAAFGVEDVDSLYPPASVAATTILLPSAQPRGRRGDPRRLPGEMGEQNEQMIARS